jgi:hypothetical protein
MVFHLLIPPHRVYTTENGGFLKLLNIKGSPKSGGSIRYLNLPGNPAGTPTKTIWIFSDVINETANFQMPFLLTCRPEQMLERAKANGAYCPDTRTQIYVYGATPKDLSPQGWQAVTSF